MSLRNISLRQLRYFIAVAETGRIAEAAKRVAISQSAITAAIQELEEEVGVLLLERGPKGAALTFKGHQFLQRAYQILNDLEDAVRFVRVDPGNVAGVVRLGVTDVVTAYYLPAVLAAFSRSWPAIEVQLVERGRAALEESLLNGEQDLGLAIVTNSTPAPGLATEVVTRVKRHVWVSHGHPLTALSVVRTADVAQYPYVLLTHDQVELVTVNAFRAFGLGIKIAYRVSSVEAVRSLVANGAGVTMLSDLAYRPWSLEGRPVERIDVPELLPGTMDIGLLFMEREKLSPACAAFREFMRGALSAWHDTRLVG